MYPHECLRGYTGRSGFNIEGVTTNRGVSKFMATDNKRAKQIPTAVYAKQILDCKDGEGRMDYDKFAEFHPDKSRNQLANIVSRVYKIYSEALESGKLVGQELHIAKYVVDKYPANAKRNRSSSLFSGWDDFDFGNLEEDNLA